MISTERSPHYSSVSTFYNPSLISMWWSSCTNSLHSTQCVLECTYVWNLQSPDTPGCDKLSCSWRPFRGLTVPTWSFSILQLYHVCTKSSNSSWYCCCCRVNRNLCCWPWCFWSFQAIVWGLFCECYQWPIVCSITLSLVWLFCKSSLSSSVHWASLASLCATFNQFSRILYPPTNSNDQSFFMKFLWLTVGQCVIHQPYFKNSDFSPAIKFCALKFCGVSQISCDFVHQHFVLLRPDRHLESQQEVFLSFLYSSFVIHASKGQEKTHAHVSFHLAFDFFTFTRCVGLYSWSLEI